MKYNPGFNRVVLRPLMQSEQSAGGVFIPQSAIKKLAEGIVLEVGPGRMLDDGRIVPVPWKVGQHVVYTKYSGSDLKICDQEVLCIDDRDILMAPEFEEQPAA